MTAVQALAVRVASEPGPNDGSVFVGFVVFGTIHADGAALAVGLVDFHAGTHADVTEIIAHKCTP